MIKLSENNLNQSKKLMVVINLALLIIAVILISIGLTVSSINIKLRVILSLVGETFAIVFFLNTGIRSIVKRKQYFEGGILLVGSLVVSVMVVLSTKNLL